MSIAVVMQALAIHRRIDDLRKCKAIVRRSMSNPRRQSARERHNGNQRECYRLSRAALLVPNVLIGHNSNPALISQVGTTLDMDPR